MPKITIERKTDWTLRQANSGDSEGVKAFYKQNIWQNKDAKDLYKWKFESNPFDYTLMWVGLSSVSNIIGNCVFMPWEFIFKKQIIKASQLVDGVVQLEYRGQGLALCILNQGMAHSFDKGASLSFAFPNENGAVVHRKNNGYHLGHILRYTKPLRSGYLLERHLKLKPLLNMASHIADLAMKLFSREAYFINPKGLAVEKVENCGKEFDEFFECFSEKFKDKIITKKMSNYLNWKYINSPNKNRILYAAKKCSMVRGFVVLESTPDIGYIVDLMAEDREALDYLISYSIKYFRKEGKDSVVFVALENNIYFKNLKCFGFIERPETKHFYIYFGKKMENKEYFRDSKNWFVTIGDCDVEAL